jgi:CRISPR/Cas system-associated endoribonuclease Cas2
MVILVTYDLRQPGRNYQSVHDYLRRYTHCKGMESVWLLDTQSSCEKIRDDLNALIDTNDRTFVVRLAHNWNSWNYTCAEWLNEPQRTW